MKWVRRIAYGIGVVAFLVWLEDPFMNREYKRCSARLIALHDEYEDPEFV